VALPVEQPQAERCPRCQSAVSITLRHCPTCSHDLGFPNARECGSREEREALSRRADQARSEADRNGYAETFTALSSALVDKSGVVVAMPAAWARNLLANPNVIFKNYETLVGDGSLKPAEPTQDRRRMAVGALLFGEYAVHIRYGALSLTDEGLPTYGKVHCRLRDIAIRERVSFVEANSFVFVEKHKVTPGKPVPRGYRAVWDNRHELALAKLGSNLKDKPVEKDWQDLLLHSDGRDPERDDFIEAHIFDGFDRAAISAICRVKQKQSRHVEIDIEIALELFEKLQGVPA